MRLLVESGHPRSNTLGARLIKALVCRLPASDASVLRLAEIFSGGAALSHGSEDAVFGSSSPHSDGGGASGREDAGRGRGTAAAATPPSCGRNFKSAEAYCPDSAPATSRRRPNLTHARPAPAGACTAGCCQSGTSIPVSTLSLFAAGPPRHATGVGGKAAAGPSVPQRPLAQLLPMRDTTSRPLPWHRPMQPQSTVARRCSHLPQQQLQSQHPASEVRSRCSRGNLQLRAGRALAAATEAEERAAAGPALDSEAQEFLHDVAMRVPSGPGPVCSFDGPSAERRRR